jgi:hypothetical protein
MFTISQLKRYGVMVFQVLLVAMVLGATVVSLSHDHCRERTIELTSDGVCVGMIIAMVRLLHIVRRPHRVTQTFFTWYCVGRVLLGVELKYGLVGGYLLGITRAVIACV